MIHKNGKLMYHKNPKLRELVALMKNDLGFRRKLSMEQYEFLEHIDDEYHYDDADRDRLNAFRTAWILYLKENPETRKIYYGTD